MNLHENLQNKGFTTGFEKTVVLRPEEAAIFVNSQLSRQGITDMKSNVDRIKESLKKAASERKRLESAKRTVNDVSSSSKTSTDTAPKTEEKPAFEYIPG